MRIESSPRRQPHRHGRRKDEPGRIEDDISEGRRPWRSRMSSPARDALTVKRVFGEPYEKDGVTIIPAARVQGGAGAGGGEDPQGQGKGSGSGFAMTARPVGAFIIREGELSWRPAVDVNRIVLGGQVVAVVALLTVRTIIKGPRPGGSRSAVRRPRLGSARSRRSEIPWAGLLRWLRLRRLPLPIRRDRRWRSAGICASGCPTATSRSCSPSVASRSTTSPCTGGCSGSRRCWPSARPCRHAVGDRGRWTRPM